MDSGKVRELRDCWTGIGIRCCVLQIGIGIHIGYRACGFFLLSGRDISFFGKSLDNCWNGRVFVESRSEGLRRDCVDERRLQEVHTAVLDVWTCSDYLASKLVQLFWAWDLTWVCWCHFDSKPNKTPRKTSLSIVCLGFNLHSAL